MRRHSRRKGFTLIELMVAMVMGAILLMGMATVLITLYQGMRESAEFSTVTGRIDLIRQLSFDARTGNAIIYPVANGPGTFTDGAETGHQIRFNSLRFDPNTDTTTDVIITWESRRPTANPTDPLFIRRYQDTGGGDVFTFGQDNILQFEIERTGNRNFTATIQAAEGGESLTMELNVTLRNVIE